MHLSLMTVTKEEAKAKLAVYRRIAQPDAYPEDTQMRACYRMLARENALGLVALREVILAGGFDHLGRPRLALARADEQWVTVRRTTQSIPPPAADGRWTSVYTGDLIFNGRGNWGQGKNARTRRYEIPAAVIPRDIPALAREQEALVPTVPVEVRPRIALSYFHILWEAAWQNTPPRDPALLRHIVGDLYAVLAVWDLTEIERAVLQGRQ